ncbi:peptidoglycan-binding domain-containing protein [Halomonas tibetensis]|uniref:Peptidoglycan-binding protein n=1 Tax=Halomonas tibetensis TaxID=2259590 RepID=A0ABV7B6T9_9GAMM
MKQWILPLGALLLPALLGSAQAADTDGNYAVRGAGTLRCADFFNEVSEGGGGAGVPAYVAWIDGYLTAHNRMTDATFDISPLVSSAEVAALARNLCRENPQLRLETTLARIAGLFEPARVRQDSQLVLIRQGDQEVLIRQETLQRVQQALEERGYDIVPSGGFDDATQQALTRFQEQNDQRVTGTPHADSVVRLLLMEGE